MTGVRPVPPTVSTAVRVPGAPGVKRSVMVQTPMAATVCPTQPSVDLTKSIALVPVTEVVNALVETPPVLVMTMSRVLEPATTVLAKVPVAGFALSAGGLRPTPVSVAVPPAPTEVLACSVADFMPVVPGVKVTSTVQAPLGASAAVQRLLEMLNRLASLPVSEMPGMPLVDPPVFLTVKVCGIELEPRPTLPNGWGLGLMVSVALVALRPTRVTA